MSHHKLKQLILLLGLPALLWGQPAVPIPNPAAEQAANLAKLEATLDKVKGEIGALRESQMKEAADKVEINFNGEKTDQLLALLEGLSNRKILRVKGLPDEPVFFSASVKKAEATSIVEQLLFTQGVALLPTSVDTLLAAPFDVAKTNSGVIWTEAQAMAYKGWLVVSVMVELKFLPIAEAQELIVPLLSKDLGSVRPVKQSQAVLITDSIGRLKLILASLRPMDQRLATETYFYTPKYTPSSSLKTQIDTLLPISALQAVERVLVQADDASNQVSITTPKINWPVISKLLEQMDAQYRLAVVNQVIYIQHGNATDIAQVLSDVASARMFNAQGMGGSGATLAMTPGGGLALVPSGGGGSSGSTPSTGVIGPSNAATIRRPTTGSTTNQRQSSSFSQFLTIIPDTRSNCLVVTGLPMDVERIQALVAELDVILPQVYLEVVIAEIQLTDDKTSGLDTLGIKYDGNKMSYTAKGSGLDLSLGTLPFTMSAVLTAANNNSAVKVRSIPNIVTTHNRPARILVGQSRPVVSSSLSDNANPNALRTQFDYKDIGIELNVTPLIGKDGMVQMQIEQKVDDIVDTVTVQGLAQPVISRRQATSFITVKDGAVIVLGGLRDNKEHLARSSMPWLPFIGNKKQKTTSSTELLVFIQPRIMRTPEDAVQLTVDVSKVREVVGVPTKAATPGKTDAQSPKVTPFP